MKDPKQKNGVTRLLEIAGQRKGMLIFSAALAVIHAILALVPYVLVIYVINALISPVLDMRLIERYLIWAGIAALASYVLLYLSGVASHVAAFNILYELRRQMARKLGSLPIGFINKQSSGALKKIISDDIERIEHFIAHHIPDFVKGIAIPVLTIGYFFYLDWRMALVSFVPLVILAILLPVMFGQKRNRELLQHYHASLEDMNGSIVEFVRAMPVMKIFGQTAESFRKYNDSVRNFDRFVQEYMKRSTPPFALFMSFISNALLPVLALGIYLLDRQGITLSVLLVFLILGVGYIKPVFALPNLGSQLSLINMGVKRLDAILFAKDPEVNTGKTTKLVDFSVEFERVSFTYGEEQVLKNVSFYAPEGSITALVGPSGAGKSTVAQLLARFWDVQSGAVKIGGTDIRDLPVELLMQHVSYNRRVIIPAPVSEGQFHFQPTFKKHYRIAWLIFTWLVTSCILVVHEKLWLGLLPHGIAGQTLVICAGQMIFQGACIHVYKKERFWAYLGNLMTISTMGSLALLGWLAICNALNIGLVFYFIGHLALIVLALAEHIRRSKLLGAGYLLTFTLVLYHALILVFVINS